MRRGIRLAVAVLGFSSCVAWAQDARSLWSLFSWNRDANDPGLRRGLQALAYIAPAHPVGNHGLFSVRSATVDCPRIELEGRYIYSQARMTVTVRNVAVADDQPMVALDCDDGEHCVEILPEYRPPVYWHQAFLVADSPASASALADALRACVR